jgi:glucuronoarabinoxylan endo-1,4-beta-xylanase
MKREPCQTPRNLLVTSVIAALLCATAALATTVVVNPAIEHQTVEGWGVMVKRDTGPQDSVDLQNATFRTFVHDDLGLNVLRMWAPNGFEPSNDNADPNVLDKTKLNFRGDMHWIFYIINTMKSYSDMKFVLAVLTPEAWMKDNGALANGGHLLSNMREEFGEYLVAVYRAIKDSTGVDLYSMCIQNEPEFSETYGSCVYTAQQFDSTLKVVGARFAREGIAMKFHAADDMVGFVNYPRYIVNDTGAVRYLRAVSNHGYTDGITPAPTSTAAQAWGAFKNMAVPKGLSTWMSESSGWQQNDALTAGLYIGIAARSGDLSMWLYLALNGCSTYTMLCNSQHTGVSAAHKHYYHWVKPGAVRIDATYTDGHLLVTAFRHKQNNTLTVVVVNDSTAAIPLTLQGTGLPATMHKYSTRSPTTPVKLCQDDGDVSTASEISIEGRNLVTLYATGYSPVVGVQDRDIGQRAPAPASVGSSSAAQAIRLYQPNGRAVGLAAGQTGTDQLRPLSAGVYCYERIDASGTRIVKAAVSASTTGR